MARNVNEPTSIINIEQLIEESDTPMTFGQSLFEMYKMGVQSGRAGLDDSPFVLNRITNAVTRNIDSGKNSDNSEDSSEI